mmetsp:Transcript_139180/g.242216  ORF Transcript_139180/g.242216 Transcript_139180/m.242216 type:complete len:87 (-) Transcript_139180:19-279(-)
MAAVRVVLPWSTCPMVPMFMWGLSREYTPMAKFLDATRRQGAATALEAAAPPHVSLCKHKDAAIFCAQNHTGCETPASTGGSGQCP